MSWSVSTDCATPKQAADALREAVQAVELAAERIAAERVAEEIWRHFDAYGVTPASVFRVSASGRAWQDEFSLTVRVTREGA